MGFACEQKRKKNQWVSQNEKPVPGLSTELQFEKRHSLGVCGISKDHQCRRILPETFIVET